MGALSEARHLLLSQRTSSFYGVSEYSSLYRRLDPRSQSITGYRYALVQLNARGGSS